MMTYEEYLKACSAEDVDTREWSPALRALRLEHRGDWDGAHAAAQQGDTRDGAWVHAYLHRKEGDVGNARYWYSRAGRPESTATLEEEWQAIAEELLRNG